jgi:hypothetical protein
MIGSGQVIVLAAWAVPAWEIFLAAAFWSRRLRRIAFLCGLIFHILIVLLLERFPSAGLVVFGMVAASCYLLFFDIRGAAPEPRLPKPHDLRSTAQDEGGRSTRAGLP